MRRKEITIIRPSSSRPEYLKQSTESLLNNIKFDGSIFHVLNEDVRNKEKSRHNLDYAEDSGLFSQIHYNAPALGLGPSITRLLRNCKTKYMFNFEDDWELLREIDLNEIIDIMNSNDNVHQIIFNKRKTMSAKYDWRKKEVEYDGVYLTTAPHWGFTPAIWDVEFALKRWIDIPKELNPPWFINPIMKLGQQMPDANWIENNLGCFYFGKIGEPAFVKHIGKESTRNND